MSTKSRSPIGWKKELAALACGLLLGSAWEAAHAGLRLDRPTASARAANARPAHRP